MSGPREKILRNILAHIEKNYAADIVQYLEGILRERYGEEFERHFLDALGLGTPEPAAEGESAAAGGWPAGVGSAAVGAAFMAGRRGGPALRALHKGSTSGGRDKVVDIGAAGLGASIVVDQLGLPRPSVVVDVGRRDNLALRLRALEAGKASVTDTTGATGIGASLAADFYGLPRSSLRFDFQRAGRLMGLRSLNRVSSSSSSSGPMVALVGDAKATPAGVNNDSSSSSSGQVAESSGVMVALVGDAKATPAGVTDSSSSSSGQVAESSGAMVALVGDAKATPAGVTDSSSSSSQVAESSVAMVALVGDAKATPAGVNKPTGGVPAVGAKGAEGTKGTETGMKETSAGVEVVGGKGTETGMGMKEPSAGVEVVLGAMDTAADVNNSCGGATG